MKGRAPPPVHCNSVPPCTLLSLCLYSIHSHPPISFLNKPSPSLNPNQALDWGFYNQTLTEVSCRPRTIYLGSCISCLPDHQVQSVSPCPSFQSQTPVLMVFFPQTIEASGKVETMYSPERVTISHITRVGHNKFFLFHFLTQFLF